MRVTGLHQSLQVTLHIPGELLMQHLQPPSPIVLYVSKSNPGAEEVAQELQALHPSVSHVDDAECFSPARGLPWMQRASMVLRVARPSTSQSTHVDDGSNTSDSRLARGAVAHQSRPTHFLLYLNFETFVGEVGALLAEEVRKAKEAELPFVMAHENDPNKGGCQFER